VENVAAVVKGLANLARHLENVRKFGVPAVVAVNILLLTRAGTRRDIGRLPQTCTRAVVCRHWAEAAQAPSSRRPSDRSNRRGCCKLPHAVSDSMNHCRKIETIAFQIYHAGDVVPSKQASDRLAELERFGFGNLPVASPRPSIPIPRIRTPTARPPGMCCRCAKCACAPAQNLSSRSAGTS